MRYVIIRDDDTNALTPVECLERLYRPLLDRGLPVNLSTIPAVTTDARMANGQPEGFLLGMGGSSGGGEALRALEAGEHEASPIPLTPALSRGEREDGRQSVGESSAAGMIKNRPSLLPLPLGEGRGEGDSRAAEPMMAGMASEPRTIPLAANQALVRYLLDNPGYHIVQHGLHHDYLEFDRPSRAEIAARLEEGTRLLLEAGFPLSQTFVAPYDRLSRAALLEVAARFRVLSTGWYELARLPYSWWPRYALKKLRRRPHWRIGRTLMLTHPGCLLSYHHTQATMLGAITHYVNTQQLTVLVTHWWEYFRDGQPDEPFIDLLHETGEYLAGHPEIQVISFADLVNGQSRLN